MPKEKTKGVETHEYIEAIGRRKTSTARVRLLKGGAGIFTVHNGKPEEYFKTDEQRRVAREVFVLARLRIPFDIPQLRDGRFVSRPLKVV